ETINVTFAPRADSQHDAAPEPTNCAAPLEKQATPGNGLSGAASGSAFESTIDISRGKPTSARKASDGPSGPEFGQTIEVPSHAEEPIQATCDFSAAKPPEYSGEETAMCTDFSLSTPGVLPPAPDFLDESRALTLGEADQSGAMTDRGAPTRREPWKI